jgi:hypothetical protein
MERARKLAGKLQRMTTAPQIEHFLKTEMEKLLD